MRKHTPGPWQWGENGLYATAADGSARYSVTILYPVTGHTYSEHTQDPPSIECDNDADRALIAAAPDMLDALYQCLKHIEVDETTHGRPFAAGNVARAAIAKATGDAP